jgi:hypothetical protein
MRYPEVLLPTEDDYHPVYTNRTIFVDMVDASSIDSTLEHLETSDAPVRAAQIRVLGGAMALVPVEATAFAHRQRRFMVNVAAIYGDRSSPTRTTRGPTASRRRFVGAMPLRTPVFSATRATRACARRIRDRRGRDSPRSSSAMTLGTYSDSTRT